MIVRQFLQWLRNAPPCERADATSALARAYLHSELSSDDLAAAEGAMIMLLDDPSPLVRQAMADVFASSQKAPLIVIQALAADQADVAAPILSRSPLLDDDDLVERVASGDASTQIAIAARGLLSRPVAAALAEVGGAEACLILLENVDADIASMSVDRIVERFGHLAAVREILLQRSDLSWAARQALLETLSKTLAGFVSGRHWVGRDQAERAARQACEKATLRLAADCAEDDVGGFVKHLRATGQLNLAFLLRALLCGNVGLFQESIAELSGLSMDRVEGHMSDANLSGFAALYRQAQLPEAAFPVFREAVRSLHDGASYGFAADATTLKRPIIESVLRRCAAHLIGDAAPLLALLRQLETEAIRDEARRFCSDLVAHNTIYHADEVRLVA